MEWQYHASTFPRWIVTLRSVDAICSESAEINTWSPGTNFSRSLSRSCHNSTQVSTTKFATLRSCSDAMKRRTPSLGSDEQYGAKCLSGFHQSVNPKRASQIGSNGSLLKV